MDKSDAKFANELKKNGFKFSKRVRGMMMANDRWSAIRIDTIKETDKIIISITVIGSSEKEREARAKEIKNLAFGHPADEDD
jgi:hypothetical protein